MKKAYCSSDRMRVWVRSQLIPTRVWRSSTHLRTWNRGLVKHLKFKIYRRSNFIRGSEFNRPDDLIARSHYFKTSSLTTIQPLILRCYIYIYIVPFHYSKIHRYIQYTYIDNIYNTYFETNLFLLVWWAQNLLDRLPIYYFHWIAILISKYISVCMEEWKRTKFAIQLHCTESNIEFYAHHINLDADNKTENILIFYLNTH